MYFGAAIDDIEHTAVAVVVWGCCCCCCCGEATAIIDCACSPAPVAASASTAPLLSPLRTADNPSRNSDDVSFDATVLCIEAQETTTPRAVGSASARSETDAEVSFSASPAPLLLLLLGCGAEAEGTAPATAVALKQRKKMLWAILQWGLRWGQRLTTCALSPLLAIEAGLAILSPEGYDPPSTSATLLREFD